MIYKFNWFWGMVTGGAIGAAVAILSTPRTGEETRAMLRGKGLELRKDAIQAVEEGREYVEDTAADVRKRFSDLKAVGRQVYEDEKELLEKSAAKAAKAVEGKTAKR